MPNKLHKMRGEDLKKRFHFVNGRLEGLYFLEIMEAVGSIDIAGSSSFPLLKPMVRVRCRSHFTEHPFLLFDLPRTHDHHNVAFVDASEARLLSPPFFQNFHRQHRKRVHRRMLLSLYMIMFTLTTTVFASPSKELIRFLRSEEILAEQGVPLDQVDAYHSPSMSRTRGRSKKLASPRGGVIDPPRGLTFLNQIKQNENVTCCGDTGCATSVSPKIVRLRCKEVDLSRLGKPGRRQFCVKDGYQ
ncbi:hypothetical protein PM082_009026 [Marasmius tenuissimus]|nr:hypothetical protein PM082_009026 [Marasmius tenuissimus]